jgi:hypothetical protein
MSVQGWCHYDRHASVDARNVFDDAREIPLQVRAQRQEVRDDHNAAGASLNQPRDRACKVGLPKFQEGRFHQLKSAFKAESPGDLAHALICRLDR